MSHSLEVFGLVAKSRLTVAAVGLLAAVHASAESNVVEVKAGDTFSGIAASITGDARTWSQLYDEQLSRLPDPNLIYPGMRFELVSEGGRRYLRLVEGRSAGRPASEARTRGAPVKAAGTTSAPAETPAPPPPPAAAAQVPAQASGSEPSEIVVGLLPNISAATLLTQYENWKKYFERVNPATKVRLSVPQNFKAFFEAAVRGEYDLAVAAPNLARTAQLEAQLAPMVTYQPRIVAQFVTTGDSTVGSPQDLKGKVVGFANPQSLVALYGQQWLRSAGLEPGRDYEVRGTRTDVGVGRLLLSGEAAGAIMSNGEFRALPPEESARLKIAEAFARVPNFIVLGHPRLGQGRLARYRSQLLQLPADKEDGAAFLRETGLTGITEVGDDTLKELDAFVPPTRRAMGLQP